jgi:ankyrin repeat protein
VSFTISIRADSNFSKPIEKISMIKKIIFALIAFWNLNLVQGQIKSDTLSKNSILINGATYGNVKEIKKALDLKAEINFKNKEGQTALYLVAKLCRYDLVKLLVENGAEINTAGNDKITPLHWVVEYDKIKIVKYLLERGANVQARDALNETPVHWAGWTGNIESAKLLLKFGGDCYAKNNGGTTPLDLAKMQEHKELEKLFENSKK